MSGIELLKETSSQMRPPVLMVTAKSEAGDIVQGLEAGADDYITKPFEPNVFTARVKALLRRSVSLGRASSERPTEADKDSKSDLMNMGKLVMNLATYEVSCGGEPLHLTPSEFKILATMGANQGRVLTRDQLIEVVQGEGISVTGRTIDTHVFGLRKKLGECSELIETIRGIGYRVKAE